MPRASVIRVLVLGAAGVVIGFAQDAAIRAGQRAVARLAHADDFRGLGAAWGWGPSIIAGSIVAMLVIACVARTPYWGAWAFVCALSDAVLFVAELGVVGSSHGGVRLLVPLLVAGAVSAALALGVLPHAGRRTRPAT